MFEVSFSQASRVEKDLGMEDLAWMVYSWDIKIIEPIKLGDRIEIATLPTKMKRFYAYRNFEVKRDGKRVGLAHTTFLLFDRKKLRPVIIDKKILEAYGSEKEIYCPDKISLASEFEKSMDIYTRKADIDVNGHVNNAVYFDYVREFSGLSDENIAYINLTYRNEIRNMDKVRAEYTKVDSGVDFRIVSDGTIHSYGKIVSYV